MVIQNDEFNQRDEKFGRLAGEFRKLNGKK